MNAVLSGPDGGRVLHQIIDGLCQHPTDSRKVSDGAIPGGSTAVMEGVLSLIVSTVDLRQDEMLSRMSGAGLSNESSETVVKVMQARSADIKRALVAQACGIASAQLEDFDWSLRVRLPTIRVPVLANRNRLHLPGVFSCACRCNAKKNVFPYLWGWLVMYASVS